MKTKIIGSILGLTLGVIPFVSFAQVATTTVNDASSTTLYIWVTSTTGVAFQEIDPNQSPIERIFDTCRYASYSITGATGGIVQQINECVKNAETANL